MEKGLIHIYTGEGKGKTCSSMGLCIRAVGAGKKVFILQFLKTPTSSELNILKNLAPQVEILKFEKPRGFFWTLSGEERQELSNEVKKAFAFATVCMKNKDCDMIILDEVMGAITNKLLDTSEVVEALRNKHEQIEVVLTGRDAPQELIDIAHYVSEIKCIKHPFKQGIASRKGVEY